MPRIPVRTEPYSDLFRQHRHYKNKRDLIIRSLGKASYINGSQFAIVFISAKGDVEKYASEMVQTELGGLFVEEVVEGCRVRVKETNDRRREQLDLELKAKGESSGGAFPGEHEEDKPLAPSEVLRSAKKKKRDALEAQRRQAEMEAELEAEKKKRRGKKLILTKGESDDEDEEEHEDEEEEEGTSESGGEGEEEIKPITEASRISGSEVSPRAPSEDYVNPDYGMEDGEDQDDQEPQAEDADITLVEIDDGTMIQKIDYAADTHAHAQSKASGPSATPARNKDGIHGSTSRSNPSLSLSFVTPAPVRKKQRGRKGTGASVQWDMDDMNPSGSGDVLPIPSLTFTTPGGPLAEPPAAETPQLDSTPYHSYITHPSTSTTTATLTIPPDHLSGYYSAKFTELQQATCKLVVKLWIKVIEPKKQSRFPYNKGEGARPGWWPEGIRHKEPDHLMKPERTALLLSIIRSFLVKVTKLEIATAEASAYIPQAKMKILREVYRVAKEEEKRRDSSEALTDIVIQAPSSPIVGAKVEDTTEEEADEPLPPMITPGPTVPNVMSGVTMSAAKAIIASTPSRAPSTSLPTEMTSNARGRKRQREVEQADKENRTPGNVFVGHASSLSKEFRTSDLIQSSHSTVSASGSTSMSRKPRTEPRPKKHRSMTLDQVASNEIGHHQSMHGYRQSYGEYPMPVQGPFASTPLHHGTKWHPGVHHTAPRPGHGFIMVPHGHGHGLMMEPYPHTQNHPGYHPQQQMDMGNMLRGGHAQQLSTMSGSPAMTPEDSARPGSSHSYMAYPMEATSSRPGTAIPHQMIIDPYAYNAQIPFYPQSYTQPDHPEYATTPQSASMSSIQPTFYAPNPVANPVQTQVAYSMETDSPAQPSTSAFTEAITAGNQYEMGEYVASSGYSANNSGEFPFVAQAG